MALLDLLNQLKQKYHFQLLAAHFDHQLRPTSHCESATLAKYSQDKGIKVVDGIWPQRLHPDSGLEAAARLARYQFLDQVMEQNGGDYLLTAHHLDDLVENILLKFIRSGNPSEMNSLKAIGRMHGKLLLRPLLTVTKTDLLNYDRENKIPFVEDESNQEDDTQRNRLRHHIIPLLKQENPQLTQSALRFSKQVDLMTSQVAQSYASLPQPTSFLAVALRLPQSALAHLSADQQTGYWQYFIWQNWHRRVNDHLTGFELLTYQGYFYLLKQRPTFTIAPAAIELGHEFSYGQRRFILVKQARTGGHLLGQFVAPRAAAFKVGPLKQGQRLLLKNGHHVKSKKKFAQAGIPNALRPYCLAIYADQQVVFVEETYRNQQAAAGLAEYYLYVEN
ncbi:tRNA(Ile)-lysidine synthase [Lactobacillus xylocopicola]|uniref:tRNA(Ile)-lysidine synthase n=2 Tax=Lactobacillus xylocopicola TaxID=2976676 RepID=A0ABM8BI03_9LACO|nr:tRNA(Ile)-lysidine synthase [Lactobacillus xylocopicola]